jgi:pre-mRNA-processing factor 17
MAAIPAVAVHPGGESFVGQSMDNQLVTYWATAERGVSQNRKKTFRGHVVAGFACQPAFSPNGAILSSGDGEGGLWLWDWKSTKLLKKIPRAHEGGPCIAVAWHPLQPSLVATAGWDNLIKLWD